MATQGKLLHLRQKIRKESFLQPGGMKKVLNAPSILNAFKSEVSVSAKLMHEFLPYTECLFVLVVIYVPVNNFLVMS